MLKLTISNGKNSKEIIAKDWDELTKKVPTNIKKLPIQKRIKKEDADV